MLTLEEFNKLYAEKRIKEMGEGFKPKKFKLTKRKTVREAVTATRLTENGIPYIVTLQPKITKEVVDTNALTSLYIEAAKMLYGITLRRVSSEGRGRWDAKNKRMIYLPSTNKGMSDLQGLYKGRLLAIEIKQPNEKQLSSQVAYQREVEEGGGLYLIVYGWEDFQRKMEDIIKGSVG